MSKHAFTVEPGRVIYRDGKPYISIQREGVWPKEGPSRAK